jgi:hypothetical protein
MGSLNLENPNLTFGFSRIIIRSCLFQGPPLSPTSTPNTIPVALDTGKLHLDWLPDGIGGYGYKRIDLTNATTDYDLQLGEEAYYEWNTTTTSNLPLRIQVSGKLYQLIIISPRWYSDANVSLYPNNTSYTNAFKVKGISAVGSSVELFFYYT